MSVGAGAEGQRNNMEKAQGYFVERSQSMELLGLLEGHREGTASTDQALFKLNCW